MKTLYEGRLDNAVDAGSIGIGERVDIKTRMGHEVASGEVLANVPLGIVLKEGGFFDRDLYLFVPIIDEPEVRALNLIKSSPDERVASVLHASGDAVPVFEAEKLDDKEGDHGSDSDDKEDGDSKEPEKSDDKKQKADDDKEPLANIDSSVDVENLPEDIKAAIISTTQMDEDQMNGVLSEISDAAIKALKRVNVKEIEIYGVVSDIQNAIFKILTKKPAVPSAKGKKKK